MMTPISPQFMYAIHKEKERELERQIEMVRTAREQRAYPSDSSFEQKQPWYAETLQWITVRLFNRSFVSKRASTQPETFGEPCPGVPC